MKIALLTITLALVGCNAPFTPPCLACDGGVSADSSNRRSACADPSRAVRLGPGDGCPGRFSAGEARFLCADGFHIPTAGFATFDEQACRTQRDFFFLGDTVGSTDTAGCIQTQAGLKCDASRREHLIFGCGAKVGQEVVPNCTASCPLAPQFSFSGAIDCTDGPHSLLLTCGAATSVDDVANSDPAIGVICVPD